MAGVRLLGAVMAGAMALAAGPAAAEWRRADTPNFVIVGEVSAGRLREIAVRFESLREALERVLPNASTTSPVPTVVVVFPDDRAFKPFKMLYRGKPADIAGMFQWTSDANSVGMIGDGSEYSFETVSQSYAHLMIGNTVGRMPLWLREGLALYYSSYETTDAGRQGLLGRPIQRQLDLLNGSTLIPLDQVLNAASDSPLYHDDRRRPVFSAQAWALTHLLLLGEPSRVEPLGRFMAAVAGGTPAGEAWQAAFGAQQIDRELQTYVNRLQFRVYRFKFSDRLSRLEVPVRPLSAADAAAFQANFLLQQQRYDEAAGHLAKAGAGGTSAWVEAVTAALETARNNHAASARRLASLDAKDDWLASYLALVSLSESIAARRTPATAEEISAARRFAAAIAAHGEIPNAAVRQASMELSGPELPSVELRGAVERARAAAPGRHDFTFTHARILIGQRAYVAARVVLRGLVSADNPPGVREAAAGHLKWLDQVEAAATPRAAATTRAAADAQPAATPTTTTPPRGAGSPGIKANLNGVWLPLTGEFIPSYRPVQDGEQRLEGVLLRIECAPAMVTFHLTVDGSEARLTAPRMQDVEFISYRDTQGGRVDCGPVTPSMPVYVTLGPPVGNAKRPVIAVEFLPANRK